MPTIHFGTGTTPQLLDEMAAGGRRRRSASTGASRSTRLGGRRRRRGDSGESRAGGATRAVGADVELRRVRRPRARAAGRPGHVFNLGHGVLPQTDPDVLDAAHGARPQRRSPGVKRGSRADGVRLARAARGRPRLLRRHTWWPPGRAESFSPIWSSATGGSGSRTARPLNAITEQTRAALEAELGLPVFTSG